MTDARTLRFHLEPSLRESAAAGQHNFIGRVMDIAREAGWRIEVRGNGPEDRAAHAGFPGWSMFHMEEPWGPRGLTFRRAYHYPFWAIEPVAERWHWHVARTPFDGARIDRREARRFFRYWRERLFDGVLDQVRRDGFVYVPLQGRIRDHRSFQAMSPLTMLETVLRHDGRPVVAALHPKESYSDADLAALQGLADRHPRLEVTMGRMEDLLPACDYVATMNSSVAFNGFFLEKPAVLFAGIDFHHIALDGREDPARAIAAAPGHAPDYEGFLWWFWQEMSINAGRPEAMERIDMGLRRGGWPG